MTSQVIWDAVVIGAGPSGALTALSLARRGMRILLAERSEFPRYKVCGCCLNLRAMNKLALWGISDIHGEPTGEFIPAYGGRKARVSLPPGIAISRAKLDSLVVDAAIEAGTEFRDGVVASVGECTSNTRSVILDRNATRETVEARVVVVAAGLARNAGIDIPSTTARHSRIGAGVMLPASGADYKPGAIHMACARGGYVGAVRVEDNQLALAAAFDGVFVKESGGLGMAAKQVLNKAGFPAIADIENLPWRGTPQLTRRAVRLGADRCLLVGDAAGYVEPFTGEGIAWALESADALASLIAASDRCFDDSTVAQWTRVHRAITATSQRRCRMLSRALRYPFLVAPTIAVLRIAPSLARPFVGSLNHIRLNSEGSTS